jgi:hypothetical protein
MAFTRRARAAFALLCVAAVLAGCAANGTQAATERAREQFAQMDEQFTTNAPPAGTDDFVEYVYANKLDEPGQLAIEKNGDPDRGNLRIVGSSRLIYSAKVVNGEGVVGVIVMGYDSPAGWGSRPATVYSCLTATFDLEHGGRPEYADIDCINELRGTIATHTHKTVRQLGG